MNSAALDASAILALVNQEPGADVVAAVLRGAALVCSVNLAEVVGKLAAGGIPREAIDEILRPLRFEVVAFDTNLAYRAGMLHLLTRPRGLSLGDRACLALALERAVPVLTADTAWQRLDLGVDIQIIR
ncbi:MAG TPA: type II toxin-antitoxin system VapC family toxin [Thermomicrobiaceae bacterium]|nr:type II toxin-antitoxin system VapC family toxin [Thermomicrobiaceae bacterium]